MAEPIPTDTSATGRASTDPAASEDRPTSYFALDGARIVKEGADGEYEPLAPADTERVLLHILHALDVYEKDGFRFVDVDASSTSGVITIRWSDYGLTDA